MHFRFIIKDQETFFTPAQRSMLVHDILMKTSYDDNVRTRIGLWLWCPVSVC